MASMCQARALSSLPVAHHHSCLFSLTQGAEPEQGSSHIPAELSSVVTEGLPEPTPALLKLGNTQLLQDTPMNPHCSNPV